MDISLFASDGSEIQPEQPVEICFNVSLGHENACLAFYESVDDHWKCEDDCLKQKGNTVCGKTEHFTNFAILLGGNGGGGCEDDGDFILKNEKEDGILIAAVVAGLWSCLMCGVMVLLFTKAGRRMLYGLEGTRIRNLRENRVQSYVVPTN